MTAGLGHGPGSLAEACEKTARAANLRLIGPGSIGVLVPGAKFNGSAAASMPRPGDLALISQSAAVAAGIVEWASVRGIGFSAVVSIGDAIDVDFADLLDYFAVDRDTRAILLYVETITDARKFMSAARAAARGKPVIGIRSGRYAAAAKVPQTHTAALASEDAVYESAFRRSGVLRVYDLDELFAAAETLARLTVLNGKRLAILTNGGGVGALAADRLTDRGGELAAISPDTMQALDAVLPPAWSRCNPIDIGGDADDRRYAAALEHLLRDKANDAVLVLNAPTALSSSLDEAKSVIATVAAHRRKAMRTKPIGAVWIGGNAATTAAFDAAGIPCYATESEAVAGFMYLVRNWESRQLLMATPPSLPEGFTADPAAVRPIIDRALREKRSWLEPVELSRLLSAYGISITPAVLARDPEEAVAVAKSLLDAGTAVVLKVQAPEIVHKSEVGGVRLNLLTERAVRDAAADIFRRAREARPDAHVAGVTVSPMIVRPKARELIVGVADDPTFGPVIVFGRGGMAVEVISDKSLALPPLDLELARRLIARTRVSRVLKAYRNVPAADERAVELLLVKVAQLIADFPEIRELDLNPVLADETGVIAVDARMSVAPVPPYRGPSGHPRFAIRPYPKEWERHRTLPDGTPIFVRPIRPEDEPLYGPFFAAVTANDLRLRFFAAVKDFSHSFVARFTQIDYARAMALIALDAAGQMLGVVRLHADANFETGEYAILVRSDLKGRGLGWLLMQSIIEYGRTEGLHSIHGQVLNENTTMIEMCKRLGFDVAIDPNDAAIVDVTLPL
jgi:acetyltransferase